GQAELFGRAVEDVNHIAGLNGEEGGGGEVEAGVVVQEVEDLDRGVVLQLPGGGIGLPRLVGRLGLEADERAARSLVRLRRDEAVALQDPPDGGYRGRLREAFGQVMVDGLRTAVVARRDQLGAEPQDLGVGASGPWLQGPVAAFLEALEESVDAALGGAMVPGELSGAAVLEDDGVDDEATERGHAPPPKLMLSTMSCDICPLCAELPHLPLRHCPRSPPLSSLSAT